MNLFSSLFQNIFMDRNIFFINSEIFLALCEVFDRADITRDGTISIAEYMALCEEYGVCLDEDDVKQIQELADSDGEVKPRFCIKRGTLLTLFGWL